MGFGFLKLFKNLQELWVDRQGSVKQDRDSIAVLVSHIGPIAGN
jgi:hypothetical protein